MLPILLVFVTGLSAIIMQLTVLREFFSVFYGNELVFGIVLGNWLLLTGLGGYLSRFSSLVKEKLRLFILLQILLALSMSLTLLTTGIVKVMVTNPGEMAGLPLVFISSLAVLTPFCVLSGFQVVFALGVLSDKAGRKQSSAGVVYSVESVGSLVGGVVFSFILISLLDSFQIIYLALFLNLAACFILAAFEKTGNSLRKISIGILILAVISLFFFSAFDLREIVNRVQYPGQEVIYQSSSLYGNLVVTRISSQINFFENGVPLFTTENTQQNEEVVHYAMAQRSSPKRVLLVSGGISGVLNEVLKYGVGMVDYVELDPLLLDLGRRYSPNSGIESDLVHSYSIDGRMFIKEKAAGGVGYDVVILNVPDPGNLQTSRFYSLESFREIKKILGDDGVLSLSMSSSENYLNPETKKLNSCIYNTLGEVFKNVVVIPGGRNYFIASDGNLTYNIAGAIEERGVNTSYVNRYYLSGMLTDERVKYTLDSLSGEKDVTVNQDFRPASYYYYLQYWTGHFSINLNHIILLLLVLFLALLIKLRPITLSVFTVGFAGASLELVLIMAFQVLYGYAYYKIGAIVTAFMFGLFIGAVYATKKLAGLHKDDLSKIVSCIALYSIILPSALHGLSSLSGWLSSISNQLFFPLATVVLGFMVGLLFPLANKMQKPEGTQEAMGLLYSLDLFGAFFGSLLTSIFLIPVYGIINVSLAVGLINLAVWLRLQVAGKND